MFLNGTIGVVVQCYLVDSKLSIRSVLLFELAVPEAFKIDCTDQHQPGHGIHHLLGQQVLDFIWWTVMNRFIDINASTQNSGICLDYI